MPIQVQCPTCQRPLRVPEELLGRLVRCPGCQGTFTATDPAVKPPPVPPPAQQFQPPPAPAAPPPAAPQFQNPPPAPPRPGAEAPLELQYQEAPPQPPGTPGYSFPAAPRPGPAFGPSYAGDPRSQALSLVAGPSLALMILAGVAGGFTALIFLFSLAMQVVVLSSDTRTSTTSSGNYDPFVAGGVNIGMTVLQCGLNAAWAGFVFFGAMQMRKLRMWGLSLAATIVAMVPLHCSCICWFPLGWLLGIGFGVWSLVMLVKPEVKSQFES